MPTDTTEASASTAASTAKDFCFVVTGFGPFNGIPDNPTSVLAQELPAYLREMAAKSSPDPVISSLAQCTHTQIVETSAQAVRSELKALQTNLESYASAIVLHLGVNGNATRFSLERCAYNDATFRVPDERGYRPTAAPVVDTCPVGSTLMTTLNVPALVNHMNETLTTHGVNGGQEHEDEGTTTTTTTTTATKEVLPPLARVSTDPGRFVCNYIYCASLDAFACAKTVGEEASEDTTLTAPSPPRVQSLFLHVPPFECVPKEEQLVFVTQLMSALYQQKKAAEESSTKN